MLARKFLITLMLGFLFFAIALIFPVVLIEETSRWIHFAVVSGFLSGLLWFGFAITFVMVVVDKFKELEKKDENRRLNELDVPINKGHLAPQQKRI
jgi:uncharacterized membrane protein YesL